MSKKYKAPKEAVYCERDSTSVNEPMGSMPNSAVSDKDDENPPTLNFVDLFNKLSEDSQLQTLSRLYSSYLLSSRDLPVPEDFLCHVANAMLLLRKNKRTNVLYNLVKGMGTMREITLIQDFLLNVCQWIWLNML